MYQRLKMNLVTTMAVTGMHKCFYKGSSLQVLIRVQSNCYYWQLACCRACSSVVDVAVFVVGGVVATAAFVTVFCYIFVLPRSWFLISNRKLLGSIFKESKIPKKRRKQ